MRLYGYNIPAILFAAIAAYLVGFVMMRIILDPDIWMAQNGISVEQLDGVGVSRMVYSPLLPLAVAVGTAILCRWTGVDSAGAGIRVGIVAGMASAVPALWLAWVYGVQDVVVPTMRSIEMLLAHAAAGAILGAWR